MSDCSCAGGCPNCECRDVQIRIVPVEPKSHVIRFPCSVRFRDGTVVHGIRGFKTETISYIKTSPPEEP